MTIKVLISHNRQDNEFCHALGNSLRVAGADVWYDEQNLGAERLMATIEREMRLRPIFIVVLSPEALASDWVREECT